MALSTGHSDLGFFRKGGPLIHRPFTILATESPPAKIVGWVFFGGNVPPMVSWPGRLDRLRGRQRRSSDLTILSVTSGAQFQSEIIKPWRLA